MPEFPIVDAHVHLYDVEALSYGWMKDAPRIARTHGLADFDAARAGVEVERLVFVEVAVDPGLHLDEARAIQRTAEADPRLAAIVAHAPLERGAAVAADLDALAALPAVRGVRRLLQGEPDPAMMLSDAFLAGVRLLPRYGFSFDLCIRHWQMAYAIELVRRCPETSFVLDHIGKPDIRHGLREPWASQMRALAALPNVSCKISGAITEADHARWTPEDVKPYVADAIEAFGFERCLYGSDWTVSELTHRYPVWVALLDEVVSGASEAERRALYRDVATRVYRL